MASCLSAIELYGSKLLGISPFPYLPSMLNPEVNLNWPLLWNKIQPLNGMYGTPDGANECENKSEPDAYPRFGIPLHRSPVVYAALCNLSEQERKKLDSREEACASEGVNDPTELKSSSRSSKKSREDQLHRPIPIKCVDKRSAPGAQFAYNRTVWRSSPYPKRKLDGHVSSEFCLKATATRSMTHTSSWDGPFPSISSNISQENINKSFSAPAELNLEEERQEGQEGSISNTGDKSQAHAILNLGKRCASAQECGRKLQKRFPNRINSSPRSTPHSGPSTSSEDNSRSRPAAGRSQQGDNFRRLMSHYGNNLTHRLSPRDIALQRHISSSLKTHGVCVIDGLLGDDLSSAIKSEVLKLHASDNCEKGQLVGGRKDNVDIRGDVIRWVDGTEAECKNIAVLCQKLDGIVSTGTGVTSSYNICGGTKVMVARYPGHGARYQRHVDNPSKDGRCLTCIYYINKNWDTKTMGGTLRLHSQTSGKSANISPIFDRVVIFYSDARNPHEVLPCFNDRYAITLWYFDRDERAKALERIDSMVQSTSSISSEE